MNIVQMLLAALSPAVEHHNLNALTLESDLTDLPTTALDNAVAHDVNWKAPNPATIDATTDLMKAALVEAAYEYGGAVPLAAVILRAKSLYEDAMLDITMEGIVGCAMAEDLPVYVEEGIATASKRTQVPDSANKFQRTAMGLAAAVVSFSPVADNEWFAVALALLDEEAAPDNDKPLLLPVGMATDPRANSLALSVSMVVSPNPYLVSMGLIGLSQNSEAFQPSGEDAPALPHIKAAILNLLPEEDSTPLTLAAVEISRSLGQDHRLGYAVAVVRGLSKHIALRGQVLAPGLGLADILPAGSYDDDFFRLAYEGDAVVRL